MSCTTVLGFVVLCACGKTGIELRPLDVVVRIWVNAVARLLRRALLQIPWTPLRDCILVYVLVERQRKRSVRAEKVGIFWIRIITLLGEESVCALTRRIGQIRWDVVKCDVLERL